jgi:hypothetical protein
MDTALKWNSCGSREVRTLARLRSREIRHGLILAMVGDVLLLGPGFFGLLLTGAAGEEVLQVRGLSPGDAALLGPAVALFALVIGYPLGLIGRWWCLLSSPEGNIAKEWQFACLLCFLVTPGCFVLAYFLGGANPVAAFCSTNSLAKFDFLSSAAFVQLIGLVVGVLSLVLFSRFIRAVIRYLPEDATQEGATQGVGRFFWFIAFVLGATSGLVLEAREPLPATWWALTVGWVVCLLGHTAQLSSASRRFALAEQGKVSQQVPTPKAEEKSGPVVLTEAVFGSRE